MDDRDRKLKIGLALTPDQLEYVRRLGAEGELTDSEVVRAIVAERMAVLDAPPPLDVLVRIVLDAVQRKTGLDLDANTAEDIAATVRARVRP